MVDVAASATDAEAGQQVTATTLVKTHNLFGSLYLAIMDRMGVKLDKFGDAETRLERL